MSYCRWSSDDFQCDVYVYESVAGYWSIHVASRRRVIPEYVRASWPTDWIERYMALSKWLEDTKGAEEYVNLSNLHSCGLSFDEESPGACADRLESLRAEGFNVPQHAIDALREDQVDFEAQGGRAAYEERLEQEKA